MKSKFALAAFALGLSVVTAGAAQASTIGFQCLISETNVANCATGASQLGVTVSGAAAGQVLFTFTNTGPKPSSITDLYWEDSSLLQNMVSTNYSHTGTVSFSEGARPPNLSGWGSISPNFYAAFTADSNDPVSSNGVNPGESLGILFQLKDGKTFTDVLSALDTAHLNQSGGMRIGMHVQSFSNGASASFINVPQSVIHTPIPTAAWLLSSGLLGLVGVARRQS